MRRVEALFHVSFSALGYASLAVRLDQCASFAKENAGSVEAIGSGA